MIFDENKSKLIPPVKDSEQEEEREDSISTRFMVGDLSAYCKGQYAGFWTK